jgi:hypothetical protein
MKPNALVISIGLLVLALIGWFVTVRPAHPTQELSQAELVQKVHSNLLGRVEVIYTAKRGWMTSVRGTFYETDTTGQIVVGNGKRTELPFTASVHLTDELLVKLLANTHVRVVERRW